ncbi:class A beta-lactamase-related serine hydrolase [Henriciella mobilis]|nr:class A beta-lactamase-related serine hydrolase [Henriciella mobilis]
MSGEASMIRRSGAMAAAIAVLAACAGCVTGSGASAVSADWPVLEAGESAAFSDEGLEALAEKMRAYVDEGHVIGMQTLLVKDGAVAHYQAYGLRQVEPEAPVTDDTIFRIYSMSKPITGVALMQLYELDYFELDDPVAEFIPEFADLMVLDGETEDGIPVLVEPDHPPTMKELLTHTAGFAYGLGGADYANRQFREQKVLTSPDMETMIDKVAAIPLLKQPGNEWYYSVAVDIQGYLVEHFSGMRFDDYLKANVFGPLGMEDTDFIVPDEKRSRLSDLMAYSEEEERFVPNAFPPDFLGFELREETVGFPSGGAGLASTISDYARFCQMMLDGGSLGDVQIISPETVALMTRNHLPEGTGVTFSGTTALEEAMHDFGFDFGVITDPEAMNATVGPGTYYWGGAAGTWFWIDPANDLFFIGMVQRFGALPGEPADFRGESQRLVYEALLPAADGLIQTAVASAD